MKTDVLIRVAYHDWISPVILTKTIENQTISVLCDDFQRKEFENISCRLRQGCQLNLLYPTPIEDNQVKAEFIVLEPDYLIDISSLAECFKPYGNHPLNYTLSRLQLKETTASILLGNTANYFMDELVHEKEENPGHYELLLKKLFRLSPFEFVVCEDLKDSRKESAFFQNCRKHFDNIRWIVNEIFPKATIDPAKIILEPSFISNQLGLQGRLDILLSDFSTFIELKSGKAMEDFRSGGQFIHSAKSHYVQMILYLAVLEFNLNLKPEKINSYLLYSKYPLLSKERHSHELLREALSLRNKIVSFEYELEQENDIAITYELLERLTAENLNTEELSGNFFEKHLRPGIDQFKIGFSKLDKLEQTYFLRLYTFILKELWLSKVGEKEYEGVKKAAVLWNAPMEDKLLAGEILYGLKIIDNQSETETHTIELKIPVYKDLYLPNFREGDAVILYECNSEADRINNRQVFKGAIEFLQNNRIVIRLRYRQKNALVWNEDSNYAVMHDYMDTTYSGMFRGLSVFLKANQDRKDLLFCRRKPEPEECSLLIGPPGTGKTSISLKQLVEKELSKNHTNILLLSYTNRAVDEICKTLKSIHPDLPFIRIGSELNCAAEFRNHLLENLLKKCERRTEVRQVIQNCRIFTGTVASIANRPEIFSLKSFDLAIVDEATQLLEPHLLSVLCSKSASGENAVRRFTLIGDHKQLPAVVLQSKEESRVSELTLNSIGLTNLSDSLFERLFRRYEKNKWNEHFSFLCVQGRMHPTISAFPSTRFYDGKLESAGLPHQTENWGNKKRLEFYAVKPFQSEISEKINRKEAEKVVEICKEIRKNGSFHPENIGIITPFRNQIALIRKCLQETQIPEFSEITVDTVERFQGSQRDVIIYSFCIKTENQLKALPNILEENGKTIDRKLNVVLTRARKQLFVIGNEELLSKNQLYKQLIEHINLS